MTDTKMKSVPKVRFEGFTDDWEQRKLGDLVNVDTGSRNHQDAVQGGRYPFYVRSENIEALDEYDFDETAILVPGDGRIGEIFHFVQGKFALHQRVYKLDGFTGVMPEFLIQLLRHGFRKHALRMNAQGTVPSLRKPVFTEWQVLIPNTKEQKPISYLLRCLDKTIALHQRKHDSLLKLKQAYLQKMFPKNGQKTPELRFGGFTDDWEQRKFSWMLDVDDGIRRGPFGSALKKSLFVPESPYAVYEQQNAIYDRYDTRYNISEKTFLELSKFEIRPGDFIMSGAGTIGRISRVPEGIKTGVFNQALIRFKIDDNKMDAEYFLQLIRSPQMQRRLTGANPGSAITNLVPMSEVKKWKLFVPTKAEQKQIARSLTLLDNAIALHQQQLDNLKQLKKWALQNLFV